MADWFRFAGVKSTDLGVRVNSFPPIAVPEERATFKTVQGKSGSLTILEGDDVYEDVVLPLTCFVDDLTYLNQITRWLRGSGELILGNEPNQYYKARSINQIDLQKIIIDLEYRSFNAMFRCKPYKYVYPHPAEITLTNGGPPLVNPGNIDAEPIFKIVGTGDIELTIGSKVIEITDLNGAITIDTDLGSAYDTTNSSILLTSKVGREGWPFKLAPGSHSVSWTTTGSVSSVKVEPNWRYL